MTHLSGRWKPYKIFFFKKIIEPRNTGEVVSLTNKQLDTAVSFQSVLEYLACVPNDVRLNKSNSHFEEVAKYFGQQRSSGLVKSSQRNRSLRSGGGRGE